MEIKEIDGKKFVEINEAKIQKRRMILQIFFLLGIIYASYAMVNAIATLQEGKEIIGKDPLIYGMGLHNFTSCQCIDEERKDWYSTEGGFTHQERSRGWINYSEPEYQINYSNLGK